MKSGKGQPLLARVTEICRALPEARRELQGTHARFSVRNRTFAYFLNNHHGDGIISVACKVGRPRMMSFLDRDPTRFYVPEYIGPRGWIALCLDVKPIDWKEVETLIRDSYLEIAPKKLAAIAREEFR